MHENTVRKHCEPLVVAVASGWCYLGTQCFTSLVKCFGRFLVPSQKFPDSEGEEVSAEDAEASEKVSFVWKRVAYFFR